MNDFKKIQKKVKEQYESMSKDSDVLYALNLEKNELWDIYLDSFPKGTNEIYRERREHDCSCCRHFINAFGDVVAIKDNKIISIWDFETNDEAYKPVIKALSKHIHKKMIKDVYVGRDKIIGTKSNHEQDGEKVITWNHFYVELEPRFVMENADLVATHKAKFRDIKSVFKRSLEGISKESVLTVLELIASNSLYKGAEWKAVLTKFATYQKEYAKLKTIKAREIYLWDMSTKIGVTIGKIRNHSMGTLLLNISDGMELDLAVKKYEAIIAPTNYKRPKPIFTTAMLEKAKKKLEELGFLDSLQRRYAILEDIDINNVLYANKDTTKRLQSKDVFEEMQEDAVITPKTFHKIEEVTMDSFIKDILPTQKSVEVYLEGRQAPNFVSLIAPYKADSKSMFKWNNNFSWAYAGNIADSDLKKNVKSAGGKVDGVLRFSIQWNDEEGNYNCDDFDAHCVEPNGNEIYYSSPRNHGTSGALDVDIIDPVRGKPAVENITWSEEGRMLKGTYKFLVNNYNHRGGTGGFRAEIEYRGQVHKFNYTKTLRCKEKVHVAEVEFDGTNFKINNKLPSQTSSIPMWNLKSCNFVPVSTIMYSPNYWDEQKGIGNKHYFFMLKDCKNEETPNGFFNEFLNNELTEHRKVLEALGSKMKVDDAENQLSGLGFSSTQKNAVIVRIEGATKRIIKIKV